MTSRTLTAMRRSHIPVTLDSWLIWNGTDPSADVSVELCEIVPDSLRDELNDRLEMQAYYERLLEETSRVRA